jgi:hypothetical protein
VGEEPVQEGFDEAGGMLVGVVVAGAEEDEGHPGEGQQPVFQERTRF